MAYRAPQYNYLCNFGQSAIIDTNTNTVYCINEYIPQSLYYRRPYSRPGWGRGAYHRRHHPYNPHHMRPRSIRRPRSNRRPRSSRRGPDYQ